MQEQNFWNGMVRQGGVLNPVDRASELLFGLIMVLTFTGAIGVLAQKESPSGSSG